MRVTVRCDEPGGGLPHFWRSTGFTPARMLLDPDMQQAMAYAGSVPHGGIAWARPHYLLDLVSAAGPGAGSAAWDWSEMDRALDVLVRNRIRPFFELMGNPSGRFSDFGDMAQLRAWRDLVHELALHLVGRYGRDEVRTWYFETWNEPDIGFGWRQWRDDPRPFCDYCDACWDGLRAADPDLVLGGPGTCVPLSPLIKAFLAHCDAGTNRLTGERGIPLGFVSVHEKGVRAHPEDLNPNSLGICEREAAVVAYIREHHPRLAGLPFVNDECDPQVGWGDTHTWRARPYYAALAVKITHQHLRELVDGLGVSYGLLSNDNGFMGTWGQRTLVTRFRNDAGFALVKKPVLNAMALLAMLGDTRCAATVQGGSADTGVLATRRGEDQVAVLVYNSRDEIMSSGSEHVTLAFEGMPFADGMLCHYRIDADHGDPYRVWEAGGAPAEPSPGLLTEMRRNQEPGLLGEPQAVVATHGRLTVDFGLPLPAVSLVLLSAKSPAPPSKVTGLRYEGYSNLHGGRDVLLLWDCLPSRCVRTYEVFCGGPESESTARVNEPDLVCTAYLRAAAGEGSGTYAVRGVDYWGRAGEPSDSLHAPA
jgi:L-iduronidase